MPSHFKFPVHNFKHHTKIPFIIFLSFSSSFFYHTKAVVETCKYAMFPLKSLAFLQSASKSKKIEREARAEVGEERN
jgi:hypothetical protein